MGKVYAVEYVTLDGVFEEPSWSGPYFNEQLQNWQWDNLRECDALLLGRVTYEGFKAAWPAMTDPVGFADRMNGITKYVATTTLTEPEWNARFLTGDPADAVATLKAEAGPMMIAGSGRLLNHLTRHRLVDEYRIMVYPVVLGHGRRLWHDDLAIDLTLTDSFVTDSGVAVLTYVPA
jgi:dihydrofolate reductase